MKRICFILASLLLFASCDFDKVVRNDLYDAKIVVIEENHERLIEATTVDEIIDILEAVKAGCQTEDAKNELLCMMDSKPDTASIRASGEKLLSASNVFIKRAGTKLEDMSPTWEETSQLVRLIRSIKASNNSYKSYFADENGEKKAEKKNKAEAVEKESGSGMFNIDLDNLPSLESIFTLDTLLQFFTNEHGDFDVAVTAESLGELMKIVAILAAFF